MRSKNQREIEREKTRERTDFNCENKRTRGRKRNEENQKIIDYSQPEIYDKQEKNELSELNNMDKDKKNIIRL